MDAEKKSIGKMLQDSLIPADLLCMMMQDLSRGKITKHGFDRQFRMRIEIDGKEMIGLDSTQDEFFKLVTETSQCDNCGVLRLNLPKMLTCSGCRGLHYCNKTCQRAHWKAIHKCMCTGKKVSKDAFRVGEFCSKMLAVWSIGEDVEHKSYINADTSRLHNAFLKHGCKDHIYMPVFENETLMYIPMPMKFVAYLVSGKAQRAAVREDYNGSDKRVTIAMQTKVVDVKDTQQWFFVMRHTFVDLP